MQVKVEVTEEDIARGVKASECYCPIALAACRAFGVSPDAEVVNVTGLYVVLYQKNEWVEIALPMLAESFVEGFDDGADCEPFDFVLDIPDPIPTPSPEPRP